MATAERDVEAPWVGRTPEEYARMTGLGRVLDAQTCLRCPKTISEWQAEDFGGHCSAECERDSLADRLDDAHRDQRTALTKARNRLISQHERAWKCAKAAYGRRNPLEFERGAAEADGLAGGIHAVTRVMEALGIEPTRDDDARQAFVDGLLARQANAPA